MLRNLFAFALLLLVVSSCKKDTTTTDYAAADKKTIKDYLAANNLTADSTASGLYYIITKPGGGSHPNAYSTVTAYYKGYLTNGDVFDNSTYATGHPATFSLQNVVAGWREGLQLIGVTGKIKLLIPSDLGYGATSTSAIPAHSVLIFDIEMVEFY